MLQIFIEAENVEDLKKQVLGLAGWFWSSGTVTLEISETGKEVPETGKDDDESPASPTPPVGEIPVPAPTQKTVALAKELGVNIEDVKGSGKHGRVVQADVKEHAKYSAPQEDPSAEPEPEPASEPATTPQGNDPFADETPAAAADTGDIEPTKENATAALRMVHNNQGMDGCMKILGDFNARKMGEVPEDSYDKFITACGEALELDRAQLSAQITG